MVYPEGAETVKEDGSKSYSRRVSYFNESIQLHNYNIYVTSKSGNLASVKLAKDLIKVYKDQIEVILLNKSKVQLTCKSAMIANKLIRGTLGMKDFIFFIPQQKVEVKGRIYMPKNISEREAFEGMTVKNRINTSAPLPSIVEVYRVPYFDKDPVTGNVTKSDSDFMLVSFCGSHVPTHVLFEDALLIPVQAYFEPVLQCKNCWFFGHSKRACRGKEKCVSCGSIHTGECTAPLYCVNCKGLHRSNDKKCPEFLKRKDLAKMKALKTVPMAEVQSTPAPASFNIFSNINFPALASQTVVKPAVIIEETRKKRRAEHLPTVDAITQSPAIITEEVTKKIINQLSTEKSFFNDIIEEFKNSGITGEELEVKISNKIKSIINPIAEDTAVSMDESNEPVVASNCS